MLVGLCPSEVVAGMEGAGTLEPAPRLPLDYLRSSLFCWFPFLCKIWFAGNIWGLKIL